MKKEYISADIDTALLQSASRLGVSERLVAVASQVRNGIRLADIGTDHALIPIMLTECGRISRAVASDIAAGPIERAKAGIAAHGLADKIDTALVAGLDGIEKYAPYDIVIAGMGGMTVIEILSASEYIKNADIRLILQPMQHANSLRIWLGENGYETEREILAREDGKIYQIIVAHYSGIKSVPDVVAAKLGIYNIEHGKEYPELFSMLCDKYMSMLSAHIKGLSAQGADATEPKNEYREILNIKEKSNDCR